MIKRIYEGQAIGVLFGAFLLSFSYSLMAEAQELMTGQGELEVAILGLVDAIKIGQVGAIIMAIVQVLKTRMVGMLMLWIATKIGWAKPAEISVPVSVTELPNGEDHSGVDLSKYLPAPISLPNVAAPAVSVALGGLAGVAESVATGKPVVQAVFEGLLSGGVSMALYDLILKPIVNKFSKK